MTGSFKNKIVSNFEADPYLTVRAFFIDFFVRDYFLNWLVLKRVKPCLPFAGLFPVDLLPVGLFLIGLFPAGLLPNFAFAFGLVLRGLFAGLS